MKQSKMTMGRRMLVAVAGLALASFVRAEEPAPATVPGAGTRREAGQEAQAGCRRFLHAVQPVGGSAPGSGQGRELRLRALRADQRR